MLPSNNIPLSLQLMKVFKALLGEKLFAWMMKQTFYGHFVAGEDRHKIVPTLERWKLFVLINWGVKFKKKNWYFFTDFVRLEWNQFSITRWKKICPKRRPKNVKLSKCWKLKKSKKKKNWKQNLFCSAAFILSNRNEIQRHHQKLLWWGDKNHFFNHISMSKFYQLAKRFYHCMI